MKIDRWYIRLWKYSIWHLGSSVCYMTDMSIALYVKIVTSFHTCAIIGVTT